MTFTRKIAHAIMLTLLAANFVCATGSARAQDQPAPANRQRPNSGRQPGLAQQLTRETREAAGEETEEKDKTAFMESASVRFIARKLGISTETASLLSFLFNFGVIVGIFIWAAGKHLPGLFRARTAAIQKAMQEAQKASDEARRKLAEVEARLMRLDGEIGMMRNAAEQEAAAEEARIHNAAQEDARKMLDSARQEIAAAAKAARRELTAYAAELAVGLAQKQIRVDAATDQALLRNFAGQLGASSESSAENQGKGTQ